ncbi:MAG TPA: hypothetical protein VGI39_40890 [Polyangiaceae bacterium]|jgi:tetratricopeptide (TPR) repeat protein
MRRPAIALLILAVTLGPASARAQGDVYDQLIGDGIALRKEGRDAEALALFERAQAHHPTARAVAQIALAHQALSHWPEAERSLLKALGEAEDEWIAHHRVYLEKSLAAVQSHLAWLSVDSNVAGAELFVEGERAGRVPLDEPLRVPTGVLMVEVRAQGYTAAQRALEIEPGTKAHEFIRLLAARAAVKGSPEPSSPGVLPEDLARPSAGDSSARAPSGGRDAAWVTLGGAGLLLAGGIVTQVLRESEVDIYNDDNRCLHGPGTRDDVCGSHRIAANTDLAVAIGLYAGAAVAAGMSTYLFLVRRSASAGPATARASCGIAGLGIACGGVF